MKPSSLMISTVFESLYFIKSVSGYLDVSLPASPSMLCANLKLVSCLPPILTVQTCPSNASVMIRSKKTLNSMGDKDPMVHESPYRMLLTGRQMMYW